MLDEVQMVKYNQILFLLNIICQENDLQNRKCGAIIEAQLSEYIILKSLSK